MEKMMNKYELVEQLKNGVVTVVFEKVDGTERTMKATLLAEYLPQNTDGIKSADQAENVEKNLDVLPVWDVEKQAWRSFRVDSVKQVLVE
jgi:hypothetical protein